MIALPRIYLGHKSPTPLVALNDCPGYRKSLAQSVFKSCLNLLRDSILATVIVTAKVVIVMVSNEICCELSYY